MSANSNNKTNSEVGNRLGKSGVQGLFPIAVCAFLLVCGIWALAVQRVVEERAEARRNITDNLENIGVALSHNVSRTSGELDTLLQFMRAMRKSKDASVSWQEIVSEDYTLNRHTVQIAVIAKDGMMITSTKMLYPPKPVDLSDREHYRVHIGASADRLFISKPVMGRASKKWSVQYTRPLFDENGKFDGAIVVSLDPEKLTKIYGRLDLGKQGGVVIVGHDGIIRAGTGDFASKLGERLSLGKADVSRYTTTKSPYAELADADGASKIVTTHDVDGYPLRVLVMSDGIDSIVRLRSLAYLLGAALFTIITIYAGYAAYRHRARESALVARQNRALIDKQVAEAAAKTKGEFLAVMSHEIRTPLNGVLGALDLIEPGEVSPQAMQNLEIATRSGEYLLALIDDILVFSKLEDGKFVLEERPVPLSGLFRDLEALFRPLTEAAGNELVFEPPANMPGHVVCDPVRLRQVLLNLLSNANKFTSGGNITLRCECLGATAGRSRFSFSVSDTGVGIPQDKQAVIFEKFKSLDASYSRRSDGTGLGLAICDKIIRAMGGRIRLVSEFGKGSRFFFDVEMETATEPDMECAVQDGEAAEADMPRLRILLAEDNDTNAYISTQYLAREGHSVVRVEHGYRAVARAVTERFDLILMDVSMPGKDGLTAAREIRAEVGPNQSTPIVALTAHAASGTRQRVLDSGMNAYLTKPIRRERLLAAIRQFAATAAYRGVEDDNGPVLPLVKPDGLAVFFKDRDIDGTSPLFAIFLTEMQSRRNAMVSAINARNDTDLRRLAHAVVGSASTVGAARVADLCKRLEDMDEEVNATYWQLANDTVDALGDTIRQFKSLAKSPTLERVPIKWNHSAEADLVRDQAARRNA